MASKKGAATTLVKRVSDLESFVSDNSAHLANLETRILDLKANLYHGLSKRVADLESQASDLGAHIADLEARLTSLKSRVKNHSAM